MSPVSGRQRHGERHPLDDLALYALDALEGDEADPIDAHLAECASCRRELATHQDALAALLEDGPPPALWDAVQEKIRDVEPGSVGGAPLSAVEPAPAHLEHTAHRHGMRRRLAVLAAAAAVAVVLGVGVATQVGQDQDGQETASGAPDGSTIAVLADAQGADVARVVAGEDGDRLVFDDLPPLPAASTYQLWDVDGTRPVSLGVVGDGRSEAVEISLPADAAELAISQEPVRDVPASAPTGPIVASGSVVRPA
jgi:anti-sigma-K factor RskA